MTKNDKTAEIRHFAQIEPLRSLRSLRSLSPAPGFCRQKSKNVAPRSFRKSSTFSLLKGWAGWAGWASSFRAAPEDLGASTTWAAAERCLWDSSNLLNLKNKTLGDSVSVGQNMRKWCSRLIHGEIGENMKKYGLSESFRIQTCLRCQWPAADSCGFHSLLWLLWIDLHDLHDLQPCAWMMIDEVWWSDIWHLLYIYIIYHLCRVVDLWPSPAKCCTSTDPSYLAASSSSFINIHQPSKNHQ